MRVPSGVVVVVVVVAVACVAQGKVYERCALARELFTQHRIPADQLATWVCIARHESEFNTSAVNVVSGDHGVFQISQLFWCSPPGVGHACGLSCDQLKDDDIKDDVVCARRIYRQHARLTGDGFDAWVVYKQHCTKDKVDQYMEGCSLQQPLSNEVTSPASSKEKAKALAYFRSSSFHATSRLTALHSAPAPTPIYSRPQQPAAVTPAPIYSRPQPAAVTPAPIYSRPQQPAAVTPPPIYSRPQPAAVTPAPIYSRPQPAAPTPAPIYSRPRPAAVTPKPHYNYKKPQPSSYQGFRVVNGKVSYY